MRKRGEKSKIKICTSKRINRSNEIDRENLGDYIVKIINAV